MRRPLLPAIAAAVLGAGHAAVTVYWAAGGTALLDTVGGSIERWARDRTPGLAAALCSPGHCPGSRPSCSPCTAEC